MIAPWTIFFVLPLLVAPWFLDFAQETKTLALQAVMALLLLGLATRKLAWRSRSGQFTTALAATFALSCASIFWAPGLQPALMTVRNEWVGIAAALLAAAICGRRHLVTALFAGAAAVAILGLLQVAFDWHGLTPASDPGQFPGVTFGNRGLASLFVALGLIPGLLLINWHSRYRIAIAAGVAIECLFVLIAMNRAVWTGVAAALLFWSAATWRLKRAQAARLPAIPRAAMSSARFRSLCAAVMAAIIVLVLAAGIVLHNQVLMTVLSQRLDPASWIANPRLVLWRASLAPFAAAGPATWFFGFGAGAFQVLAPRWLANTVLENQFFLDAHNDLLQYFLEYGIVGIALRAGIIAACLRRLLKNATVQEQDLAPLPLVFFCNAMILLIASLFFFPLRLTFFISMLVFFLAGASENSEKKALLDAEPGRVPLAGRVAAAALAVLALAGCWQRSVIEIAMRTYVKEKQPYLVKAVERRDLEERLARAPVPEIYLRIVQSSNLTR